ncbi:helix-turn-helix domain-containing protein [Agromyces sp. S2-1-8]|uniref:helix-turn-helix domain-containing protein n=1 Tax=Agromyces sp. S2-1-8 TaxID=2897180 RepID=UPI001E31F2AD|nr:helix-turn-helix domain-containing protein [Agromyces sp. S2-1-8]MCD5348426.1 helix-turn-helix domain-containing protein [Agromyces sp. S2-1-8]
MTTNDSGLSWPDSALAPYGETMSVREVALATRQTPRVIRDLISHPNEAQRLPASKIGRGWIVGKVDLREYLIRHRNIGGNR